jgi:hypothetical protein
LVGVIEGLLAEGRGASEFCFGGDGAPLVASLAGRSGGDAIQRRVA